MLQLPYNPGLTLTSRFEQPGPDVFSPSSFSLLPSHYPDSQKRDPIAGYQVQGKMCVSKNECWTAIDDH